jgi:Family of unknown function (DUF6788)
MAPSAADREALAAIARSLAQTGFAMPGSLTDRTMRCGKAACRCARDPDRLHGPYHQWTRKIDGKTVTINLTDEQAARYAPWFANAQTLRALISELEELTLRIASQAEGWR